MSIPARILRAHEQDRAPAEYALTEREQRRHERILASAQCLMSAYGRANIAFRELAIALRMGSSTLRFHLADLDALLGEILFRHLQALAAAIGRVQTDPKPARRAAYLAYTRGALGGLTEAHLLFVRDRHLLPPDLLEGLEAARSSLGEWLAGDMADEALLLLDSPIFSGARIEACLATKTAAPQASAAPSKSKPIAIPSKPALSALLTQAGFTPALPAPAQKPRDWVYAVGLPVAARGPPA
jgi:AcrR family transcriptional regulator